VVNPIRYARVLGGVSALLAGVSGCADTGACAGVGVVSQVGVYFAQDGYDDLAGASVQLCANGKCVEDRLRNEDITSLKLGLPDDVGPDLGTVRFRSPARAAPRPSSTRPPTRSSPASPTAVEAVA
jgi:hypothetical protein